MRSVLCVITTLALFSLSCAKVLDLDESNWNLMLKGEWMVEFFAPWCPACKNLMPTWEKFADTAANFNVKVAKVDVTTSPSLSGRFFVTALPTIYHVIDGEFRQYRGSRDIDALTVFVQKKDWKKLEQISAWKNPDSLHMSILSYFFKLSHMLKEFNGRLQEEYGLPSWGSYALFAIGTIFVGAVLGLLLVCVVDFIFPPKKASRQSFSEARENAKHDIEDLANDEIEDDAADEQASDDEDDNDDDDEQDNDSEKHEDSDSEDQQQQNKKTDDDDGSTSEGEKNSHNENEALESKNKKSTNDSKTSPGEVRKRKPRKAD